jgi:hypothetical protein
MCVPFLACCPHPLHTKQEEPERVANEGKKNAATCGAPERARKISKVLARDLAPKELLLAEDD